MTKRIEGNPLFSAAVEHNGTVYVSGQVADDTSQPVKGQTEQILRKIEGLLAQCGSDKSKVLMANVWVTDMRYFAEMNEAWKAWVDAANKPARATVGSPLARPDILVEIAVIAHT